MAWSPIKYHHIARDGVLYVLVGGGYGWMFSTHGIGRRSIPVVGTTRFTGATYQSQIFPSKAEAMAAAFDHAYGVKK